MDIFYAILSSAVISTIISFICGLYNTNRKDYIENITQERKLWRNELRSLASEISLCKNRDDLLISSTKLKVRINAYGIAINDIYYDACIWNLIKEIESKDTCNYSDIEKYKIKIVDLLSCLLKYDWERSKAEIKGNVHIRILLAVQITIFIVYSIYFFSYSAFIPYYLYCFLYAIYYLSFSVWFLSKIDKASLSVGLLNYFGINILSVILLKNCYDKDFLLLMLMPIVILGSAAWERYKRAYRNKRIFIDTIKVIYPFTEVKNEKLLDCPIVQRLLGFSNKVENNNNTE